MHYQQLGLGAVLALSQPREGALPAVELPGLRHLVYAQDEGHAACEERVSELRVQGQVMPPPPRAIVVHAAAWEDRHIWPVGVPGGAERVDRPVRPGIARSPHTPHAAQPQRPLLCEGAPLSREAVAQQDV